MREKGGVEYLSIACETDRRERMSVEERYCSKNVTVDNT